MRFHITIMKPDANRFYPQAFHEIVETLAYGLSMLGHDVSYRANVFVPTDAINIVLGGQFASPQTPFPLGTIFYNLEQIGGNPFHMISPELISRHAIWEYSTANMPYWREHGIDAQLVPIGYVPQLSRITPALYPDIDVLFFGSANPRRLKVMKELEQMRDLNFTLGMGFGKERDPLIARAKVILNIHYYERPQLFEQVRCSYLLSNRKCIVSETSDDFPPALTGAICEVPYEGLTQACRNLVKDVETRLMYQRKGYELFSKLREVDILRGIFRNFSTASTASPQLTKE